ncbi:phosphotriesterase [Corynebacterium sp.]|uniref:phosphotriesterase family protein n=1 Tax=Corynebacterium sp. TaxID=1720 RepID=UPI0026E0EF88|nr:phosphotriesterase [Corynebacterium sp.]MDO5512553.1 phosphotriesterase [Corynebacterium sp.]
MTHVNTVLGPVDQDDLGIVAVHEALLSVFPGAQYAPDITFDRPEIFSTLEARLKDFASHGGGTIVDATGMFHGRDLPLLEALSRATGVHIVASTGQGPEGLLGGYFLTPQTNPPTPWPAEKFAELFEAEVTEGMVIPRVERRAPAGLIVTAVTREGRTATDESLLRGAARAAAVTGAPLSFQYGNDALGDLDVVLSEGLDPSRILIGGADRVDAPVLEIAARGVYVGIDNIGTSDDELVDDDARARLIRDLIEAGHTDRIIVSASAIGVAKGLPGRDVAYSAPLAFVRDLGFDETTTDAFLRDNPRAFLSLSETT